MLSESYVLANDTDPERPLAVTFEGTPAAPSALELAARRFHEHQMDEPLERIAELISEDAEMRLLVAHLRLLCGKHAIVAALEEGREAEMYAAKVERCELLDEETLLVAGHARYAAENGGVAHSAVWWLDRFRDGLLRRAEAFLSEAEARAAYEEAVADSPVPEALQP
jgi:hypothetical protein